MEPKPAYTLEDLKNWEQVTRDLSPPARLCVFGDPVGHSLSPQMQNPALAEAGVDSQYVRIHVKQEELETALRLLPEKGFVGANVTVPHKPATLEIVDDVDEGARLSGGVNTVVVEDGQLLGFSTDGGGFQRAIREEFYVDLSDLRILIIGAGGGAGRAVAAQCAAEKCQRLVLANRTLDKAVALARELQTYFEGDTLQGPMDYLAAIPWEVDALAEQMDHVDIIVNATSLGMKRTDPELIPTRLIQPHQIVYDMVYSPARTRLLAATEEAGARGANGLSMLLHQGAISFETWFNRAAPVEAMRAGLTEAVGK